MLSRLDQQGDGNYVSEILEQRNVLMLLESIKESPKSVQQLATKCKIPLSTTYRTIGEMTRLDFVKIKYVFNESGKWEKIYRYNEFFIEHIKNQNVINKSKNFESDLK
jgi:predicted transcriptional regulator